jgi:glutathione S-transferase
MAMTLYELAGKDPEIRFSPYCWRIRLALAHKGLAAKGVAWRFTEKAKLAFAKSERVPVLVDGGRTVVDSWQIAEYLDTTYDLYPPLLGGTPAHLRFLNAWTDGVVHPLIARIVLKDIHDMLAPEDQAYFRQSRERGFGMTLEEVVADRGTTGIAALRAALAPVRTVLKAQPWLGGEAHDYADYILLGSLQWARCVSRFELLAEDDPIAAWHARGLALFDGLLATAKRA